MLLRAGLFFRIFYRSKSEDSLTKKILTKEYSLSGNKLQDSIGIRVALYFADDLDIVRGLLKRKLVFVDETIDKPDDDEFRPSRVNLIFRIPDEYQKQLGFLRKYVEVDSTYELQLRTVLSEGWHEVEHDLRYKCKGEWQHQLDLSRTLNGVFATLETCDWSMLQVFDELAYRHYKSGDWQAMLRNKFRIRFDPTPLSEELRTVLTDQNDAAKKIIRLNRERLLRWILDNELSFPILFSNIVYLVNYLHIKSDSISRLTPAPIAEELERRVAETGVA